jgi:5-methylcytosine-specific restriction protein A
MAWHSTSRQSRDYGTEWDKLRLVILRRDNGLCQCGHCKAEHRTTIATEVDHIVSRAEAKRRGWSKAQTEDPTNLQAINTDCHKRKTQEETGGKFKRRPRIGIDGFPIG